MSAIVVAVLLCASCSGSIASDPGPAEKTEPTEVVLGHPIFCSGEPGRLVDAESGESQVPYDESAALTRDELEGLLRLEFGREGLAATATISNPAPGVTGVVLRLDGVDVGYLEGAKTSDGEVVLDWYTVCEEVFGG